MWCREGVGYAYKTQTVGGLEGLSGTGVPLLESSLKICRGIAEDMVASCARLSCLVVCLELVLCW